VVFVAGCAAGVAKLESKFLNNRTKTRESGSVTNLPMLQKKFTNSLRPILAKPCFQTACGRYGDKWLAKRRFSGLFFRVTPVALPQPKTGRHSVAPSRTVACEKARRGFRCGRITPSKNTRGQEFHCGLTCGKTTTKKKKPGRAGLF